MLLQQSPAPALSAAVSTLKVSVPTVVHRITRHDGFTMDVPPQLYGSVQAYAHSSLTPAPCEAAMPVAIRAEMRVSFRDASYNLHTISLPKSAPAYTTVVPVVGGESLELLGEAGAVAGRVPVGESARVARITLTCEADGLQALVQLYALVPAKTVSPDVSMGSFHESETQGTTIKRVPSKDSIGG